MNCFQKFSLVVRISFLAPVHFRSEYQYAWRSVNGNGKNPQRCKMCKNAWKKLLSLLHHNCSRFDFFPLKPKIFTLAHRLFDSDGSEIKTPDFFLWNDSCGTLRKHCSCHDADRLSRTK